MSLKLSPEARTELVGSVQRYFDENFDEAIGNVAAGALLDFFMAELGPVVYNQAVEEVCDRLALRVDDLRYEIRQDEFQYWRRAGGKSRA